MQKRLIVVTGSLASGKSTFAVKLSHVLGIPYLVKDTFKSAICQDFTLTDRAESSRFSAAAFHAMMYVTQRMMETGYPLILEGNFMPAGVKKTDEAGTISALAGQYDYAVLTFKFTGDTAVLRQRYIQRESTPERGQANRLGFIPTQQEFDQWCHNCGTVQLGEKTVTVDTTDFDKTDFSGLIRTAELFVHS